MPAMDNEEDSLTVSVGSRNWVFTGYSFHNREAIFGPGLGDQAPKLSARQKRRAASKQKKQANKQLQHTIPEESEVDEEEDVYTVERITDKRVRAGNVEYRVHWEGYDDSGDTWEPLDHLDGCQAAIMLSGSHRRLRAVHS
jgi:hypothetical protein